MEIFVRIHGQQRQHHISKHHIVYYLPIGRFDRSGLCPIEKDGEDKCADQVFFYPVSHISVSSYFI